MATDSALSGFWEVTAAEQVAGRTLRVIGGIPGDLVQFTEDGRYVIRTDPRRSVEYRYRAEAGSPLPRLDLSGHNPDFTTHAVYRVEGDELVICAAANGRERPTDVVRDDERLWVLRRCRRRSAPSGGCRPAA